MIDQAIDKINIAIEAQIGVLATGRAVAGNAQVFNELVKSKEILIGMKGGIKSAPKKEDTFTCEHCGTTGLTKAMYGRWHGDACKKK